MVNHVESCPLLQCQQKKLKPRKIDLHAYVHRFPKHRNKIPNKINCRRITKQNDMKIKNLGTHNCSLQGIFHQLLWLEHWHPLLSGEKFLPDMHRSCHHIHLNRLSDTSVKINIKVRNNIYNSNILNTLTMMAIEDNNSSRVEWVSATGQLPQ